MVIDGYKLYRVSAPLSKPLVNSTYTISNIEHVFLELYSEGFTGFGYIYCFNVYYADIMHYIVDAYCKQLVKKDIQSVQEHWDKTYKSLNSVGQTGIQISAYAAVDTALWDLQAQIMNQPLYRLLGGSRTSMDVYISGGWLGSNEELISEVEESLKEGHKYFKIRLGKNLKRDIERVNAVYGAFGDSVEIFADANQGYTHSEALCAAAALEQAGVTWLEEPVFPQDYQMNADICKRSNMRIVSGESLFTRTEHHQLMIAGGADLIMPDLRRAGGVTEYLRIANEAFMYGIPVASHVFTPICGHILSAAPNGILLECVPDWWRNTFAEEPEMKNGKLWLNDVPGHGIKLDHSFAEKYAR